MSSSGSVRGAWLAVFMALLAAASGCRTHRREDRLKNSGPEVLYKHAHEQLNTYDYANAIKTYETLTARFPFTDQARQARLDLIYAYYRSAERESALDAADQFIRENPTHPRVDYAWYIKGLVDFEHPPTIIERAFHADLTQRAPTNARKSFDAFRTVVEQYPKSEYAHDALRRMIFLRDRLASYEVNVARYYMRRGAYVAAAQRAKRTIEQYDGAPAISEALEVMIDAYDRLGLQSLADQTRKVYQANFSGVTHTAPPPPPSRHWWQFWKKNAPSDDTRS